MTANFHTHTARCRHAEGADEEYVRCAVEAGLQTLGFSDHTPYPFPGSYYSTMRMYPHEFAEYAASVRWLKDAYADRLDIRLGVEAEYYPAHFEDLLTLLRGEGTEYMILGQHWLDNEQGAPGNCRITEDGDHLLRYCDQTIRALQTGLFTYFAHPDMLCFRGSDDLYQEQITRLCRAARECGVPLEINLLGLRTQRHYPDERFWKIASQVGNDVILGCDAHAPAHLLDTSAVETAMAMAERLGLKLIKTVPLRPIK